MRTLTQTEPEYARLLTLTGLCGLAISQPLLSVFGNNPSFFVFVGARRADAVLYAVALTVVPPLLLWAIGNVGRLGGAATRSRLHILTVGALLALFVVQLLTGTAPQWWTLVVGTALGGAGAVLYARHAAVRTWTQFLAVVPALALAGFLFTSPVAKLYDSSGLDAVAATEVVVDPSADLPSVIWIVLDELPTRILLDENGVIDAERYPNIATFSGRSTWYRSHSTVTPRSDEAIPSLLTGREPFVADPVYAEHPENIFRLLGATHHLAVSEAITALCPPSECGVKPVGPPSVSSTEPVPRPDVDVDRRELYDRTLDVFFDRLIPGRESGGRIDDFEESFVPLDAQAATSTTASGAFEDPAIDDAVTSDDFWVAIRTIQAAQPARYDDMLDLIYPTDVPTFYFLHLILPHIPYNFFPDGTFYETPVDGIPLDSARNDPWLGVLNEHRLRLQTEYVDGLLGQLFAAFDEADVLDDALVVLAADHGIGFALDTATRDFEGAGEAGVDTIYSPLFIKEPGQVTAVVDDTNATLLDLMPTVASLAGLRVPDDWDVDGIDLNDPAAIAARGSTKTMWRFRGEFEPKSTAVIDYDQVDLDADLTRPGLPGPRGEDPMAEFYGRVLGPTAVAAYRSSFSAVAEPEVGEATLIEGDRLRAPAADAEPLGVVVGSLDADHGDGDLVVVAVDDQIVGFSPPLTYQGQAGSFVIQLPPGTIAPGAEHEIAVGILRSDGDIGALEVS